MTSWLGPATPGAESQPGSPPLRRPTDRAPDMCAKRVRYGWWGQMRRRRMRSCRHRGGSDRPSVRTPWTDQRESDEEGQVFVMHRLSADRGRPCRPGTSVPAGSATAPRRLGSFSPTRLLDTSKSILYILALELENVGLVSTTMHARRFAPINGGSAEARGAPSRFAAWPFVYVFFTNGIPFDAPNRSEPCPPVAA